MPQSRVGDMQGSTEGHLPLQVVFPLKVVFQWRSASTIGHLPPKVVFHLPQHLGWSFICENSQHTKSQNPTLGPDFCFLKQRNKTHTQIHLLMLFHTTKNTQKIQKLKSRLPYIAQKWLGTWSRAIKSPIERKYVLNL